RASLAVIADIKHPPSNGTGKRTTLRLGKPEDLPPPDSRRHVLHDRLEQPRVEIDAQLVGYRNEHGVCGLHRSIRRQLLGDHVGLADERTTETGHRPLESADLILAFGLGAQPKEVAVLVG